MAIASKATEIESYQDRKRELGVTETEIQKLTKRAEVLRNFVAAYEALLDEEGTPVAPIPSPPAPAMERSDERDEMSPTFRGAILKIIQGCSTKRGISFEQLMDEARRLGLESDAASLTAGVRYAISGLKKKEAIWSPRRGYYRVFDD
ncbi:MAG: hypothetical protein PXZ07_00800 [Candidatus Eremiobacteraeota bacterium]|nr:hypothetical protein [Candidatus Eremiobacteraeota bacterium]